MKIAINLLAFNQIQYYRMYYKNKLLDDHYNVYIYYHLTRNMILITRSTDIYKYYIFVYQEVYHVLIVNELNIFPEMYDIIKLSFKNILCINTKNNIFHGYLLANE